MSSGFDDSMYDRIREGCQRSADVIVPLVCSTARVRSVVDIGCGEGWFARKFAETGSDVVAIDVRRPADWDAGQFVEWDLTEPLPVIDGIGRVDLAVCLEVAEHLPFERGPGLVDDICDLAPLVLWSAAIPGQGGHLHINEQWPSYWAVYFAARDYWPFTEIREWIWADTRVEPWYRQNLILFAEGIAPRKTPMLDLVHPDIFKWYR